MMRFGLGYNAFGDVIPVDGLPFPVTPDEVPGHCEGANPQWSCPQYAVRNGVVGAVLGSLIGGWTGKHIGRVGGAMAGAAFFGLATWYLFSGRWWR